MTTMSPHQEPHATITIDQEAALASGAERLTREFDGTFGRETIDRFLHASYTDLAQRATVPNYLPLLTEKFARQRLRALAKVDGLHVDGKPTVLFLCVHNAGRSQMAAGYLESIAGDRVDVRSAGSEPRETINPVAVEAMAELGIDLGARQPKLLTTDAVREADVVITMGCGDACPIFPGKRYEDWELTDPAGQPIEVVRQVRDEIRARVDALVAELDGRAAASD